jgi:hypothetical protein
MPPPGLGELGGRPDDPPPEDEGIGDPELVGDGIWQLLRARAKIAVPTMLRDKLRGDLIGHLINRRGIFGAEPRQEFLAKALPIIGLLSRRFV